MRPLGSAYVRKLELPRTLAVFGASVPQPSFERLLTATIRFSAALDRELREHLAAQHPDSRPETLDPATVERLRQLGYVE